MPGRGNCDSPATSAEEGLPKRFLQFSGGKDSLACLYLLEPFWDELTVAWGNSGAAFPEVLELMERVRRMVPHFLEVRSDVRTDIARHGWPTDVAVAKFTTVGEVTTGARSIRVQLWSECCQRNLWKPMHRKMYELGARLIIRGQRNSERYKAPIPNRAVHDGIQYWFPLEGWTAEQVLAYLRRRRVEIPRYYETTSASLECWCCTAYNDLRAGVLRFMQTEHPQKYALVRLVRGLIQDALEEEVELQRKLLTDEDPPGQSGRGYHVGVMAQELEHIHPEAVLTGPDGYERVDYRQVVMRALVTASD